MPRDLFPREADRAIIDAFLRGKATHDNRDAEVLLRDHKLIYMGQSMMGYGTIAWFDTAGSLAASLPRDHETTMVVNHGKRNQTRGVCRGHARSLQKVE
jgi:hypothetical protein